MSIADFVVQARESNLDRVAGQSIIAEAEPCVLNILGMTFISSEAQT